MESIWVKCLQFVEDFNPDKIFLQRALPTFNTLFNSEPQEPAKALGTDERCASKNAVQLRVNRFG